MAARSGDPDSQPLMTENVNFFAFAFATTATALATPAAIAVARRIAFYDRPSGYKQHAAPTPYLGGAAVILGLFAGSLVLGAQLAQLDSIVIVAVVLLAVGTLDDRIGLGIGLRLVAEVAAGAALFYSGFGWSVFGGDAANLLLTVVFVVAVVNAYNLMDNVDGATSTVALISAGVIGVYATLAGAPVVGAMAAALAGACAGFLPFNLAKPQARIFLGDGGSMAIGVTLAAMIMALPGMGGFGGLELLPVIVILVGLPALDTALVIVSRLRRGVNVLSGGRDHLTHRLHARLGSSQRVAVMLAGGQAVSSSLAIGLLQLTPAAAVLGAGVLLICGLSLIVVLETIWAGVALGGPGLQVAAQDQSPA